MTIKVLFVCLGNICRSPMAEGVLQHKIEERGFSGRFFIDSAGTASYHIGDDPDHRTLEVLRENGISLGSKGRQVSEQDFEAFDYILVMDQANFDDLQAIAPVDAKAKVLLFREFDPEPGDKVVPDPYYGTKQDFQKVYTLVNRTADGFIDHLLSNKLLP